MFRSRERERERERERKATTTNRLKKVRGYIAEITKDIQAIKFPAALEISAEEVNGVSKERMEYCRTTSRVMK